VAGIVNWNAAPAPGLAFDPETPSMGKHNAASTPGGQINRGKISEKWLRIFRRLHPAHGMMPTSPMGGIVQPGDNVMTAILETITLGFIPAFLLLGLAVQARDYDTPRWWRTRMTFATLAVIAGTMAVASFWGSLLAGYHLLDLSRLGTWAGAGMGILVYEFGHYWYHRCAHRFEWLWRVAHQMHHSAEAMDAFSANYLHPVDVLLFTTWSSLVFFPLLGLTAEAGAVAGAWVGFNAMFQHANIRTPRWLGYLVQRPESHVLHHQRGRHQYNYANLPLWDIAFATFVNPGDVGGIQAGFYNGASTRILDMLLCQDVSRPSRQPEAVDAPLGAAS
jgi:sterol desaturase/sphingolipid hydroxylase (fatty acid hydroxylase superfamily)